jgi:hypothetical protein
MRVVVVALFLTSALSGPAMAYLTGGGGTGCDGCGEALNDLIKAQPDEQQAGALELYKNLVGLDEERLAFLKAADDQVCSHTDCEEMESTFVRRLVSLASDKQQSDKSNRIAWIGTVATAISTFIALAALYMSFMSDRRSRRLEAGVAAANIRSIKGEV